MRSVASDIIPLSLLKKTHIHTHTLDDSIFFHLLYISFIFFWFSIFSALNFFFDFACAVADATIPYSIYIHTKLNRDSFKKWSSENDLVNQSSAFRSTSFPFYIFLLCTMSCIPRSCIPSIRVTPLFNTYHMVNIKQNGECCLWFYLFRFRKQTNIVQ